MRFALQRSRLLSCRHTMRFKVLRSTRTLLARAAVQCLFALYFSSAETAARE